MKIFPFVNSLQIWLAKMSTSMAGDDLKYHFQFWRIAFGRPFFGVN